MKINLQVKLIELIFGIAYYPWVISWMFTSSYYKDIFHPYGVINIMEFVGVAAFVLYLVIARRLEAIYTAIVIIFVAISAMVTYGNENASFVFYTILLVAFARNIDGYKVIRNTMLLQILALVFVVGSSLMGIIPNESNTQIIENFSRIRYGLGYTYTSFAPNFLLSIAIEYIFVKRDQKHIVRELLALVITDLFFYKMTQTRLSFFMVLLAVLIEAILQFTANKEFRNNIIKAATIACIPLMVIINIMSLVLYANNIPFFIALNRLLSQRLRFANLGIATWGIKLLGNSVTWNTDASQYNYIDSSYVNILVCYGLIIFLITVMSLTILCIRGVKAKDRYLCIALILWSIRAAIDPQLFLLWFNPFLLLIFNRIVDYSETTSMKNVVKAEYEL